MTVNSATQAYVNSYNKQSQSDVSPAASSNFDAMMQNISGKLLNSMDTNGNGSIDKTEFSAAAKQLAQNSSSIDSAFKAIDTNSDGSIDSSELAKALEQTISTNHMHRHRHHHIHAQSGASGMASLASGQAQTVSGSQVAQTSSNQENLQSVLLDKILSAYDANAKNSTSNINLSV
ncbi:MAG: EF-hand domain-containing protein [Sulfurospirillaceae bacterium]|nr:EF-hand domain-containing protein [Sulfurospirillaceae bacterium]